MMLVGFNVEDWMIISRTICGVKETESGDRLIAVEATRGEEVG